MSGSPTFFSCVIKAAKACPARCGDFAKIRWFQVPGRSFPGPTGECVARWEPGPRVYVADFWIGHEMVARHEMLHDLIGRSGHPNPPFGAGCPLTWDTWPSGRLAGPAAPSFRSTEFGYLPVTARVVKPVDTRDLKSLGGNPIRVRVPARAFELRVLSTAISTASARSPPRLAIPMPPDRPSFPC